MRGDVDVVRKWCNTEDNDVDVCHSLLGLTALHGAARSGQKDIVSLLLKQGASINSIRKPKLQTPLHLAAQTADEDIVSMLCKNGADIRRKDAQGKYPLDLAKATQNQTLIELLRFEPERPVPPTIEQTGPNFVQVKLHHSNSHGSDIGSCEIKCLAEGRQPVIVSVPAGVHSTHGKVSGLLPSSEYAVCGRLQNASGHSAWSQAVTFQTLSSVPSRIQVVRMLRQRHQTLWR